MDTHVRRLGYLNITYAILGGLGALLALLAADGPVGVYYYFDARMTGVIAAGICVMHVALALPTLIGGIGVMQYRSWARVLLIVASALNALTFPIGTLLGAYGLWVLMTPEVEPLFSDGHAFIGKNR
jgi:hypothetical protein